MNTPVEPPINVEDHLDFVGKVVSIISRGLPDYISRDDLYQAGVIGLITSVERFDPNRSASFQTYAYHVIKGDILKALRDMDHMSRWDRRHFTQIKQARKTWQQEHSADPTPEDLAEITDMPLKTVKRVLENEKPPDSLEYEIYQEGATTLKDVLPDESAVWPCEALGLADMIRELYEALEGLTERERLVMRLYYHEGMILAKIGKVLGVTGARVDQIHKKVLEALYSELAAKGVSLSK